jgi:hypothetical protein
MWRCNFAMKGGNWEVRLLMGLALGAVGTDPSVNPWEINLTGASCLLVGMM